VAQLHEYKAKQILAENGIEIPRGEVVFDTKRVVEIAEKLGGEVVVKAQIHSTSRAASGGIKFAQSAEEAERIASEMLNKEIAGNLCEAVLIDEIAEINREFYLGFIVDTTLKRPTLLFSDSGGSGIEERVESLEKLVCSISKEPTIEEILDFVQSSRLSVQPPAKRDGWQTEVWTLNAIAEILQKLYRIAKKTDARTAEINPLALLKDGRLVALDCRISVDDYADFRQKELGIEIARELGHTPTKLERIAWNIEKDDFRGTFFFVEILNSQQLAVSSQQKNDNCSLITDNCLIGFHGAGGGGSMASLDAAQRNGLQPACYVDTSGNPPASKVYRAAKIILSIPNIRGYFLSGSGVASQEQFGLARAVLKAFLEVKPHIPAVLRLGGNGEDIAKSLVERYAKFLPAPIEAYRKQDSADYCASRLFELISNAEPQSRKVAKEDEEQRTNDEGQSYSFKTKTGTISFDYKGLDEISATKIVESCPQKILKSDENKMPVLAIEREEAERGKCSECLACEFASLDLGLNAVKIEFPIEGLN
jgi:succinyl-CoA synthetase beta subunit